MMPITKNTLRLYEPKKRGLRPTLWGGECDECDDLMYANKNGKCQNCKKQMKVWMGFNKKLDTKWEEDDRFNRGNWHTFMKKNGARRYVKV